MRDGERRTVYLGAYPSVTLAQAREAARVLAQKTRAHRASVPLYAPGSGIPSDPTLTPLTVVEATECAVSDRASRWDKPEQTTRYWLRTFELHVFPLIGSRQVSDIRVADVARVLRTCKHLPRTANVVRSQLVAVFHWVVAQGYRADNPAAGRVLSSIIDFNHESVHHRALPHAEVSAAVATVRGSAAWEAEALLFEFLVLTAVRSGEARGARWPEFDLDAAIWTVPGERMKTRKRLDHQVPLSGPALAVLRRAQESPALCESRRVGGDAHIVFPSRKGKLANDYALSRLLNRLRIEAVPHGFRSSFRDWCGETGVDFAVAEKCLAHAVGSKVSEAYARSDLFNRRVRVMADWGEYVSRGCAEDGP